MDAKMIARAVQEYGTPSYVFDIDVFQNRIRMIQEVLGSQVQLCYAMKANPFLIGVAAANLARLEVCSPGEFAICERNQIPAEQLVLSGVYKEQEEIEEILEKHGASGIHTIESEQQFKMLATLAEKWGLKLCVLLRLTSGNQFGLNEEVLKTIVKNRADYPGIQILGVQYYSGTQKKKAEILEQEIAKLDSLLSELKELYGYEAKELEYGPGLYVPYFITEGDESKAELHQLREQLMQMQFDGQITLEMGRYMAASCGTYLTKVVDEKENARVHYAIVDGGIHHLNYFGQTMAMKLPYFKQLNGENFEEKVDGEENLTTVCGSLCTVSDVLVKKMPLHGKILGDVLAFENTGAYSVTEGIYLFLSRAFPKVIFATEENGLELMRDTVQSHCFNGI